MKMATGHSLVEFMLFVAFSTQGILIVGGFQRFEKQPQYTEVNPGEDVELTCTILNKRGACSWQKNNKPVGIYKDKYEWAGSQESGDCSLRIRHVAIDFDDGEWECQVTASEFTAQDALTSTPVRLVVRVAPQWPRIEVNNTAVSPGNNISSDVGKTVTVKCISRYGNPPARLKWFLDDKELLVGSKQTSAPEMDNNRTWVATSLLDIVYTKDLYGRTLRCVALHRSYPKESQEVSARLDVKYGPEVRLEGVPTTDLEEGMDTVVLKCVVDSNPPSVVRWKVGEKRVVSTTDTLQFRPVKRMDSGSYYCEAENSMGTSVPLSVVIDVKYPPRVRKVGPTRLTTAPLYSDATFSCEAEGNPLPKYQWLQKVPMVADTQFTRGSEPKLRIANITYDHQGEYLCRVSNVIGGSERFATSEPITVQVVGAPQVLRHAGTREVLAVRGEEATLKLVVCADPRPRRAMWEWGSEFVETGKPNGRYRAELREHEREDCYEARLHVRDVEPSDSRSYYLAVENEKGSDRHAVHLTVREPMLTTTLLSMMHHEPVPMTTLLSIAAGCLVVFLLCVFVAIYVVRKEKCCFARRGDFRPTDLESEKSDLNSDIGRKGPLSVIVGSGPGAIPTDTLYSSSAERRLHGSSVAGHEEGSSPEAMKLEFQRGEGPWKRERWKFEKNRREGPPAPQALPLQGSIGAKESGRKTGESDCGVSRSVWNDGGDGCEKGPGTTGEGDVVEDRALPRAAAVAGGESLGASDVFRDRLRWDPDCYRCFGNLRRASDRFFGRRMFDDVGNVAGRSDAVFERFSGVDLDCEYVGSYSADGSVSYLERESYGFESPTRKNRDRDTFREGKCCRGNRRVAPIYMANPYQPDSIDRAEI